VTKMDVFLNVTPCSLVDTDVSDMLTVSITKLMTYHPRRQQSSCVYLLLTLYVFQIYSEINKVSFFNIYSSALVISCSIYFEFFSFLDALLPKMLFK
jgi:hypothetical protein